jgi:hypothetical protein
MQGSDALDVAMRVGRDVGKSLDDFDWKGQNVPIWVKSISIRVFESHLEMQLGIDYLVVRKNYENYPNAPSCARVLAYMRGELVRLGIGGCVFAHWGALPPAPDDIVVWST